ncbi:DUF6056 family protein [Actinomadura rupiterrae]|uniref:DUF6056 family protein n=1 Tax=Actinomadura rupiterrae TaxID=559627 RepID=UPI0020A327B1|nr:DUF6056 family protein [Actinomadura rupiterrae]MCP2335546.1 hypothetical protein [Actinomadura rupiterrae]
MVDTAELKQRTPRRHETGDPPAPSQRPAVVAAAVLLVAFAATAGVMCFLGTFTRPASDDFRFIGIERAKGFFGPCEYLYTTATGRIGNGVFVGLAYLFPDWGMRLTPAVTVLALAVAAALLTRAMLSRAGDGSAHPLAAPLAGLGTAVLSLGTQPRPYQTLYWTAGVITHTLPPALVTGLVAVALLARSPRARLWTGIAAVPLGLLAGTTSETISAAVLILVVLGGIGHLLFVRRLTWLPMFGALFGASTVVGALIVLTSPGHAVTLRQRTHSEPLISAKVLADTVSSGERVLMHLATDMSLPAAAAIGFLVCVLARSHRPLPAGKLLYALVAGAAGVLALTFAVMWELRVGWGHGGWTFYRGWFVFRYAAVLVAAFYGYAAADIIRRLRGRADGPSTAVCAICLALVAAACTSGAARLRETGTAMANRAAAFDAQSARIERAKRAGARTAPVAQLPIANLAVPFERPGRHDWLGPWIASYYGLASVTKGGGAPVSDKPRILAPGRAKAPESARALPAHAKPTKRR